MHLMTEVQHSVTKMEVSGLMPACRLDMQYNASLAFGSLLFCFIINEARQSSQMIRILRLLPIVVRENTS